MQIWRDEFLRLAWKMLIRSDEHHTLTSSTVSGPLSKGLCFCERYAEGSGVRNGAKLSGRMVDSQKIDWVNFSERIVAKSCDFILDSHKQKTRLDVYITKTVHPAHSISTADVSKHSVWHLFQHQITTWCDEVQMKTTFFPKCTLKKKKPLTLHNEANKVNNVSHRYE